MTQKTIVWRVNNFQCSSCVRKIENSLKQISGVLDVQGDFTSSQVSITYDNKKTNLKALTNALKKLGYPVISMHKTTMQTVQDLFLRILLSIIFVTFILSGYMDNWNANVQNLVFAGGNLIVMFWSGNYIYLRAYRALRNKTLNMYSLISLSTVAAWIYSFLVSIIPTWIIVLKNPITFWELPSFVITLIIFGEIIEKLATAKVQANMEKLLNLKIEQTRVIRRDQEIMVNTDSVQINEIILVKPGERIPLDGIVADGHSMVSEANITGEARDIEKTRGSQVYGGSINKNGILYITVLAMSDNSTLAQVVKMVREAKLTKLPIQTTVDYVASIFVPFVVTLAVGAGIYWLIVANNLSGIVFAFSIFLCTLLIACPCALGLATPLTITTAFAQALKRGILIKNAEILSKATAVETIVFDKTGTLTTGELSVSQVVISNDSNITRRNLFILMNHLTQHSSHPLSRALYEFTKSSIGNSTNNNRATLSNFHSESGMGLSGNIGNQQVIIGNQHFFNKHNISINSKIIQIDGKYEDEPKTHVMVAVEKCHLATVFFDDQIRPEALEVVDYLQKSKIEVWLLSGDNTENTARFAQKMGIINYMAEANPISKVEKIRNIKENSEGVVCMVGDGINDAAALAQSDVSISMNNGIDITLEASEVVLMHNQLSNIPYLLHISHKTMNNIKQNLIGAFFYNVLCIPVAMGVLYPSLGVLLTPAWATVAMICSSLTVTLNSLRMLMNNYKFSSK